MKDSRRSTHTNKQNRDWFFARCRAYTGQGAVKTGREQRRAAK